MAEDNNFKFSFEALLNLRLGDTAELEKKIADLAKDKGPTLKVNIGAAASSAQLTKIQENAATLAASFKALNEQLAKGKTGQVTKLVTSIEQLVSSLSAASTSLDKNTAKTAAASINTLATSIQKLAQAAQETPDVDKLPKRRGGSPPAAQPSVKATPVNLDLSGLTDQLNKAFISLASEIDKKKAGIGTSLDGLGDTLATQLRGVVAKLVEAAKPPTPPPPAETAPPVVPTVGKKAAQSRKVAPVAPEEPPAPPVVVPAPKPSRASKAPPRAPAAPPAGVPDTFPVSAPVEPPPPPVAKPRSRAKPAPAPVAPVAEATPPAQPPAPTPKATKAAIAAAKTAPASAGGAAPPAPPVPPPPGGTPPSGGGTPPSGGGRKPPEDFSNLMSMLNKSFTDLASNIKKASQALGSIKGVDALINEAVAKALAEHAASAGINTGAAGYAGGVSLKIPGGDMFDVTQATSILRASNQILGAGPSKGGLSVTPGAAFDVSNTIRSLVSRASTVGKNDPTAQIEQYVSSLPEDMQEKYRKKLEEILSKASKGKDVGKSLNQLVGFSEKNPGEIVKEVKSRGGPGSADTLGKLTSLSSNLRSSFRLQISRSLLSDLTDVQKRIEKETSSETPDLKILDDLRLKEQAILKRLLVNIKKGVSGFGGKRRSASQSEYESEYGGFLPQVGALVDSSPMGKRSEPERKRLAAAVTLLVESVDGNVAAAEEVRKEFNLVNVNPVRAAVELITRGLKTMPDKIDALDKAIEDIRLNFLEGIPASRQRSVLSGLKSERTRLEQGKGLKRVPLSDQLGEAATFVGGSGAAAKSLKQVFSKTVLSPGEPGKEPVSEEVPRRLRDSDKAARQILHSLKENTSSAEEFRAELEKILELLKQMSPTNQEEAFNLVRLRGTLGGALQENVKHGGESVISKPVSVFGIQHSNLTPLQKEAGELAASFDASTTSAERFHKIFGTLSGDSTTLVRKLSEVKSGLAQVYSSKAEGVNLKEVNAQIAEVEKARKAIEKGVLPPNISREQQLGLLPGFVQEETARLKAAGKSRSDKPLLYQVKNESGQGFTNIAVAIKQATDAQGNYVVSAHEVKSAMMGVGSTSSQMVSAFRRVAVWGTAAGLLYGGMKIFRDAISLMIEVESSIVKVGKVMEASTANFENFKRSVTSTAVEISTKFGVAIQDVLKSMFTFAQQGLELPAVEQLSNMIALAENVTNLSATDATEALTAAMKQFNFEATDSLKILDAWNEIANKTAIEEDVLANATKKAATAAVNAGVSFDQFNGMVAAIGSATRQSGEQVGTGLRSIFQRINRPSGRNALAAEGITVSDLSGNLKGFVPTITELHAKWGDLNEAQKLNVATGVSGIHHYNTFLTLMEHFDDFLNDTAVSANSQGSAMRENAKVMETAAKQYTILREKVKEAGLELSSAFLPIIKSVIGLASGLVTAFGAVPDVIKVVVSGMALMGLATMKFGHTVDYLLNSLAYLPKAGEGFFSSVAGGISGLAGSIGAGKTIESLSLAKQVEINSGPASRKRSIQVGDFKKNAAQAFLDATPLDEALMIHGPIGDMSKFSAAVRGIKIDDKVLGIKDMNSVTAKLGLTMAIAGQSIAGWSAALFKSGAAAKASASATAAAAVASKGWLVSVLPLAGALAAVGAVLWGISKAYSAITDRGDEVAKSFDSQVAGLEENLKAARAASIAFDGLANARDKLAKSVNEPDASTNPVKIARNAGLAGALPDTEKKAFLSAKGISSGAIEGMDEYGRVTLKSNEALKVLSHSAVESAATHLSLVKAQQASALAAELTTRKWYQTSSAMERYKDAVKTLISFDKEMKEGTKSIQGIDLNNEAFSGGKKIFGEMQKDIIAARGKLAEFEMEFKRIINSMPKETSIDFFAGMPHIEEQAKILEALAAVSNRNAAPTDKAATKIDALNALVASVKTGIKDLDPLAERSFRKLITKGGIRPFSVDKDNIQEVVTQAKKGTSDLEGALAFVKQPGETVVKQWTTRVDEDGNALIGVFDDLGNHVEEKIRDLVASGANIQIIKPGALVDQITEELSKIKKIATGAGAGINFLGELKLGARLSQDLTPQEKTAKEAPEIYKGAYKAALAYENQLKKIEGMHKGEDRIAGTSGPKVLTDQAAQLDKLASTANAMSYIARLSTEISTLGLEAEKAATKVRDMAIDRSVEAFASKFKVGAEKGIVEGRKFNPLKSEHELTQQERFNRDYGSQIDIIQGIDDEAVAAKDRAKRAQKLSQDLPSFLKDFQSSTKAFKSEGDVTAYVDKLKKEVLGGKDTQLTANVVRQDKLLSATEEIKKHTQRAADALEKKKSSDSGERTLTAEEVEKDAGKSIGAAIGKSESNEEILKRWHSQAWPNIKNLFSGFAKVGEPTPLVEPGKSSPVFMDFIKKLAKRGGKATPGDAKALADEILASAVEERDSTALIGSKWGFDVGGKRLSALDVGAGPNAYAEYEAKVKAQKGNEKRLDDVIERLKNAGPETFLELQKSLNKALEGLNGTRTRGVTEPTKAENIVTGKQAVEAAIKAGATVVGKISDKAFEDIGKAVSKSGFLQSLLTGVNSIHKFVSALDDSIYSIKKNASVRDAMQELNSPIAGAMKGVVSAQFSQEDLGKDFQDLSGFERATRSAPNTSKFMSDFKSAESQAKKVAEDMASSVFDTEQRIKEIRDRGGQEQEGQLRLLEQARGQEVSMLDKLKGALSSARDSMGGFFDKFRNIVLVEEAKKKIEDLFRSFNIAKETRFNTDSIDRAMGRSPFSVTPTKLGEPRDLNAFQRELFHINKKLSSGVSGEEHSQLTRRKEEIKFDMEEAKITRAQDKEKEKLQQQVDLGKNALDTLAGLKQRGVKEFAGFDISSTMQLLKSQLETAGDIKPGARGPKGEQYFKGIPLLGQLEGQLDALKNQKEEVDLGKQREVLMKPLENIATQSKEELVKINENLSKAFKDAIDKGKEGESGDSNKEYSKGIVDNLAKPVDNFSQSLTGASAELRAFEELLRGFSRTPSASTPPDQPLPQSTAKAQGGFVSGPSGVDKVPARLTAGEFVISKGGVDALRSSYGDKVLHAINAGRIPKFAEGGRLTRDDFLELIANEGAIDSPSNESYTRQLSRALPAQPSSLLNFEDVRNAGIDSSNLARDSHYNRASDALDFALEKEIFNLSRPPSISLGLTDANGEYLAKGRFAGVAGAKTLFEQDAAGNVLSGGDRPYYPGAKTIASDLYDRTGTYLIDKEQASSISKYDDMYRLPTGLQDTSGGKPNLAKIIARANAGEYGQGMQLDVSSGKLRMSNRQGSLDETFANMAEGKNSFGNRPAGEHPRGDSRRRVDEGTPQQAPIGPYSTWEPLPEGTTEPGPTFRRTPLSYRSAALLDDIPSFQSRSIAAPAGGLVRDAGSAGGTGFRATRSQVPSPVFAPDRDAGVPSTVSHTTRDAGVAGGVPATEPLGRPYVSKPPSASTNFVSPPDHISRSRYEFPADAISHGRGFRPSHINFKDSEGSTFDNIRFKTGSTIDHLRFGADEGSTVDYLKFGDNEGSTVLGPRRAPRGPTSSWSPLDKVTQKKFEDENYRKKVLEIQALNSHEDSTPFSTQEPLDRGDLKFYNKNSPVIVINGRPEDDLIAYVSGEGPTSDDAQLRAWRRNRWPNDFYSEKELEEMKRRKGKSSFRPWSPLRRGFAGGGLVEEDNKYLSQEEGKKLIDDILTQSMNMHVDAYSASQKPSGLSEDKEGQKYLYEQAVKHHNFMGGVKFSGEGDSQTIQLGGKFFPASRESSDFLRAQLAETQGILDRLAGGKEARNKSPILSSLTSGEFAKEKGLGVVSDTLLRSVAKPIAGAAEFFGGIAGSAGESLDVALKGGLADPLLSRKGFGARLTVAGGLGAAAFGAAALPGAALATIGKGAQFGFSALGAYTGGTHIGTGLEKIVSSGKVDADSLSDILGGAGGVALSAGPFLNMARGMGGKYTPPPPYKPPASYIKRMRDLGEEGPSVGSEGLGIAKVLEEEALKAAAARAKTIEAMPAYEKSLEESIGASREYYRRAAREAESVGPKPIGEASTPVHVPPRWYLEKNRGFSKAGEINTPVQYHTALTKADIVDPYAKTEWAARRPQYADDPVSGTAKTVLGPPGGPRKAYVEPRKMTLSERREDMLRQAEEMLRNSGEESPLASPPQFYPEPGGLQIGQVLRGPTLTSEKMRELGFSKRRIDAVLKDLADLENFPALAGNRKASGGPISGPGGPKSDIIPILASNGEYIINAKSVKSLGLERLEYLNNHGKLPKFAEGGLVGSKGSSSQQVEIDPSIITKAIEEAFSSAGQKFSDSVSKIDLTMKPPENLDLTIKSPADLGLSTITTAIEEAFSSAAQSFSDAASKIDLTIKPPESTDFLTLRVPEIPPLKLPDNIPELKITGGPGAARLDAIESSLDIIRENLSGVQKTVETSQETFMSNSGVMDIVSNMLQEYHGNSMTELNERFSSTEQNLKSSLSGVAERLSADFSSELLNVESKVTQVSSVAQSALSRSMLRG